LQIIPNINEDIPLEEVRDPLLMKRNISLFIKREDFNHPQLSGNKWYKLKYNLKEAKRQGKYILLTFGGAYSNHIYATAAAGKIFNFQTIGIIRGEEHLPLNPTITFAKECGMQLYYLNRKDYRKKDSDELIARLKKDFGDFYLLPEGGTNELAVQGCVEIIANIEIKYDYICCPCGTGGTLAGLITGLKGKKFAMGFAALKNASFLKENVKSLLKTKNGNLFGNWDINLDYHFGGYARFNKQLIDFIDRFISLTGIQIEPIYTGKMLFGIYDLISKGYFRKGSKILAIHTGGLQGLNGLRNKIDTVRKEQR